MLRGLYTKINGPVEKMISGMRPKKNLMTKVKDMFQPKEPEMWEQPSHEWHPDRGFRPSKPKKSGGLTIEANKYIKQQGGKWVITQKGTGKVLSHHDSKEKAEASFRAMEMNKHGSIYRPIVRKVADDLVAK
jgi:hypothetical protein